MMWSVAGLICVLLPAAGLAMFSLSAKRPSTLGITDGRLANCPDSPNCVSSQGTMKGQVVEPLRLTSKRESGENDIDVSKQAIARLAAVVASFPQAKVVSQTEDYLHAEFTSRLFRFVDDVEFHVDVPRGVIQCRSASRVGYSDMGANRRRIEAIRAALAKEPD